ncbi:MAG: beta-galactosidase [Anaerolineae bacterium]
MFYFGVDYYPEHWPEEDWSRDARLMAEAGFNVVRLAEFAWSKMEPKDRQYDFDWLDRAISLLASQGMRVVLGTPTASPPPWLMTKYPELFRVREDGQRVTFGNRRTYCPNNPTYRDYTQCIVARMAEHYADHPAVIGWQIDNEFGDRCYCPVCTQAFRDWLRRRHASLDTLNQKWGTVFWSHIYNDWGEIPPPLTSGGSPNPGLALDFFRFSSDSYVAYQQLQMDILREMCPEHFVIHNLMGFGYDRINYFDLARSLDFVAWNNYRRMQWNMQAEVDPSYAALAHDTIRGLKHQNFWITEQQAGSGGWEVVSVAPRPGELRLWAYQAIAHGADGILFFRWRTARFGTEQYWHGLLEHDGRPSRRYEEIKQMGAEIKRASEWIHGSAIKPSVAMMLSYDSRFAFQIQGNNPYFSYSDHFQQIYRAFHHRHALVDVVDPTTDLSAYKLVVAPALHIVSDTIAENLEQFVQAGGVLVVTSRTGVKDEANAVVDQRLPGLLSELCGAEVEEYDSLPADVRQELEFTLPALASAPPACASIWCDVLRPGTATVAARYTQDYYAGKPCITLNQFGRGQVVYIGTVGDTRLYGALTDWLFNLSGVQPVLTAPEGVEVAERWQGDQQLLFLLNHADDTRSVALSQPLTDLLTGQVANQRLRLEPRAVMILREA